MGQFHDILHPSGLPVLSSCSKDTIVTISYQVPVVNLYSQIYAPATYSTCNPTTVVATLLNQQLGGAGHFIAHITLPNIFSISSTNNTLQLVPPLGSPRTVTIASTSITHVTDADTSKQDWTIKIDSLTDFTNTSMLGMTGLNNASGPISLSFNIIAGCNTPPNDTIRFGLSMNGWRFCNLLYFNPAVPGDINDTFPSVVILPAIGSAFNGCGPYLSLASMNENCYAGNNAFITVSPSVSATYGAVPGYKYTWSPTEPALASLTYLTTGIYTVTVTDTIKHCTAIVSDTITQPVAPLSITTSYVNASYSSCSNGSVTAVVAGGTPGYTYTWNSSPVQNTATATNLSGGHTYTVTVIDSKGCSVTASVVVPMPPAFAISGSSFICNGSSTILDAGAGDSLYRWSTADVTQTISISAAGTYTVTITRNGCTATASFILSTSPLPDPVTTITGYELCSIDSNIGGDLGNLPSTLDQSKPCTQVCSGSISRIAVTLSTPGDSVKVTIVGGTKVFNAGLSSSSVQVYDVTWGAAGQGGITVQETYLGGCSRLRSFCIDILSTPIAKFGIIGLSTSGTVHVCSNNAIQFSDSSTFAVAGSNAIYSNITGWHWDFGDGTGSNVENPSHTYTAIGNYTISLTVYSSCNCTNTTTLSVKADSATAMDIQCPSIVCSGGSATYTVTGCSNVTWGCIGGTITAHTATTATITWGSVGSSGFGFVTATPVSCQTCKNAFTVKIPVITHSAAVSGPTTICVNNDTYFNLPLWPGAKYNWSIVNGSPNPSASIVAFTNENKVFVRGATNGTFTLKIKYTDPVAGCSDSSSLVVTVVSKVVDSASPAIGCVNNTVRFTLTNSATSPWVIVTPSGDTVRPGGGASLNTITYVPPVAGDYTINVTSANACIDAPLTYHVDASPHVTDTLITGPQAVCPNTPSTYIARVPAPAGIQYLWTIPNASDGAFVGTSTGNSVIVRWTNPAYATACTLAIAAQSTTNLTCVDTTSKRYFVTIIEPDSSFNAPSSVCPNTTYTSIAANSNLQDYYTWSFTPSNLASCQSGDEHNPHPHIFFNNVTTPTNVVIRLTVTRCNRTIFKEVTVSILATPTVTVTGPSTGCIPAQLVFTATPSIVSSSTTYSWNTTDGSDFFGVANTLSHSFLVPGTNWVNVTAHFYGTCNSIAISNFDTINILAAAPVSLVTGRQNVFICPPGSPVSMPLSISPSTYASSSVWTLNGAPITAVAGHTNYTATTVGTYAIQITDSHGCTNMSSQTIAYCPAQPPACPGINFSHPALTVNACTDVVKAQVSYSIPTGYTFAGESWKISSSIGLNVAPGSTPVIISAPGLVGSYIFTINKAGSGTLYYNVFLRTPIGDTTSCSYAFQLLVPLQISSSVGVVCNPVKQGYALTLADNSTYGDTSHYTYSWTFSPSVPGSPYSGTTITTDTLPQGHIYNITYNISGGVLAPGGCSRTFADTIPIGYPNAAFNYIDTPLSPNQNRSSICQNFAIILQPTVAQNNNWRYHWHSINPGNNPTDILAYNPPIEYGVTLAGVTVGLTVTDNYGCSATSSKTIANVNPNSLAGTVGPTTGTNHLIQNENAVYWRPGGGTVTFNYLTAGTPTIWNWYYASTPTISLATTSTYTNSVGPMGRYLCIVKDNDGCQALAQRAGTIQTLPMPPVGINGKRNFCVGDTVVLTATSQPKISYSWTIGSSHYTAGPIWTVIGLAAGTYTATLSYTDTFVINSSISQTCTGTAPAFTFTINALPTVTAALDTAHTACDPYSVGLTATGTAGLTSYTWSNGATTQSTHVTVGGDYRVWLTGPGGCTSHADIRIPDDPAILLQYVPYGCYTYNCDALTGNGVELDGPPNTLFKAWSWNNDGSAISGHTGSNNPVRPDTVYTVGDYSLTIYDGIDTVHNRCSRTSPLLHISASPMPCEVACHLLPTVSVANCISRGIFNLTITVHNSVSSGASYDLTSPSGTFTGLSPSTLATGVNTINATFTANIGVTGRVFMVITLNYPSGVCQDTLSFTLPTCTKMLQESQDDAVESNGIKMLLMPNPATDKTNVVYSTGAANDPIPSGETMTLILSDINGKEIEIQQLVTISGTVVIDVSAMAPGIYFVTLRRNNLPLATDKLVILSR